MNTIFLSDSDVALILGVLSEANEIQASVGVPQKATEAFATFKNAVGASDEWELDRNNILAEPEIHQRRRPDPSIGGKSIVDDAYVPLSLTEMIDEVHLQEGLVHCDDDPGASMPFDFGKQCCSGYSHDHDVGC